MDKVLVHGSAFIRAGVMPFPGSKTGDCHFHATLISRPGCEVRPETGRIASFGRWRGSIPLLPSTAVMRYHNHNAIIVKMTAGKDRHLRRVVRPCERKTRAYVDKHGCFGVRLPLSAQPL